jgi:hypothetical protein
VPFRPGAGRDLCFAEPRYFAPIGGMDHPPGSIHYPVSDDDARVPPPLAKLCPYVRSAASWNLRRSASVSGPGRPSPILWPSMATTGMATVVALEKNASRAR